MEQLLFRLKTSRRALKLIWLLAEAENEDYGNNSTGVFVECFYPGHPQMPLPLSERAALLRTSTATEVSSQGKLVAVKALEKALTHSGFVTLRHSIGPTPLDQRPRIAIAEFQEYARELVHILLDLTEGQDEVARAALEALPQTVAELGIQALPEEALRIFARLVEWARADRNFLDVAALSEALRFMQESFIDKCEKPEFPADHSDAYEQHISEIDRLLQALSSADFATRLKRWAGKWTREDYADRPFTSENPQFQRELRELAIKVVEEPESLSGDLIAWLISPSAQKSNSFFFQLGQVDEQNVHSNQIVELGRILQGTDAFVSYWMGWIARDHKSAESSFEKLAENESVTKETLVQTTVLFEPTLQHIARVRFCLEAGQIDPGYVAGVLGLSRWMESMKSDQFEQLLRAIAGPSLENTAACVELLAKWLLYRKRPVQDCLADFAWTLFENEPKNINRNGAWNFDRLAAKLTQADPERGFQLLQKLTLKKAEGSNYWGSLDLPNQNHFWETLYQKDKKRLFTSLLGVAQTDNSVRRYLSWSLRRVIDQEETRVLLLALGTEDREKARIVATWITSAKPGFWPIAFGLIKTFPHDQVLFSYLAGGIEQEGTAFWGAASEFYEGRRGEVEKVLQDPDIPPEARSWLREILDHLEYRVSNTAVWEYDEDVDDLRRYIQDKDSGQRIWAIGRILKFAKWEDVRRLLTTEDIAEALPQIDLPEQKRIRFEKALKVWQNGI